MKAGGAIDVLLSQKNRKLLLYRDQETTLQDRVEQLYETLQKLIDHKAIVEAGHKGLNAKPPVREYLEGWDFTDVATDEDPFDLKVMKMCAVSPLLSWPDFTRSIPAVTL